ncbi:hypothetical protein MMC27_003001 [Xylographa pallens]|nr:hypothetical protein [Xylographa pallens]
MWYRSDIAYKRAASSNEHPYATTPFTMRQSSPDRSNDEISLKRHAGLVLALNTPKGRGVFASRSIPARTIIEESPVIVLPLQDLNGIKTTLLNDYTFNWPYQDHRTGKECKTQAVVLGLGSLFNHDSSHGQNVGWRRNLKSQSIIYTALRDIDVGEELCISYGAHVWFELKGKGEISESETDEWDAFGRIEWD